MATTTVRAAGCAPMGSTISIERSTIADNYGGGGLAVVSWRRSSRLTINDSTISGNDSGEATWVAARAAASSHPGAVTLSNSTVTGNHSLGYPVTAAAPGSSLSSAGLRSGGQQQHRRRQFLELPCTAERRYLRQHHGEQRPQHLRQRTLQAASPATARTSLPGTIFAAIDPDHRRRQAQCRRDRPAQELSLANPALSGGDPLAAGATGQLGAVLARCRPAACPTSARSRPTSRSRPAPPPTTTCSPAANAANNLAGLAGND